MLDTKTVQVYAFVLVLCEAATYHYISIYMLYGQAVTKGRYWSLQIRPTISLNTHILYRSIKPTAVVAVGPRSLFSLLRRVRTTEFLLFCEIIIWFFSYCFTRNFTVAPFKLCFFIYSYLAKEENSRKVILLQSVLHSPWVDKMFKFTNYN